MAGSQTELNRLLKDFQDHLYLCGFVLQRYHSGLDGKKLTGESRPEWKRIYIELRGKQLQRWEAGNICNMKEESIQAIKEGRLPALSRELEQFKEIDIVKTEFRWKGRHKAHPEIQNLVVLEGITGSDKTYWNFGNSSLWLQWRAQIRFSRMHYRLLLVKHMSTMLSSVHEFEQKIEGDIEWIGGQLIAGRSIQLNRETIKFRGEFSVSVQALNGIFIDLDGTLLIRGKFKCSKMTPREVHCVSLRCSSKSEDKKAGFVSAALQLPPLGELQNLIEFAKQTVHAACTRFETLEQLVKPLASIDLMPIEATELISPEKPSKHSDLEEMFDSILPVLIEESPFESVPAEYFYKALLNAWEVIGIDLVPSPQTISTWMKSRSYRTILNDGQTSWIGFRLNAINFELYKRRNSTTSQRCEEII